MIVFSGAPFFQKVQIAPHTSVVSATKESPIFHRTAIAEFGTSADLIRTTPMSGS